MTKRLPTASQLSRALECPASTALPSAYSPSSPAAEHGTGVHAYLADCWGLGRDVALERIPSGAAWRAACHAIGEEELALILRGREVIAVERTYAFDVLTQKARVLGDRLGRGYSRLTDTEIAGTADLVLWDEQECRYAVLDYKTGSWVGPPESNAQMGFLALAVGEADGGIENGVDVELVYLDTEGGVRAEAATLTFDLLREVAVTLADGVVRIREAQRAVALGQTPPTNPGEHCKYCGCKPVCPAWLGLAREWGRRGGSSGDELAARLSANLVSPREAGEAWRKLEQLEALVTVVKAALKDYARHTAIQLPDGGTIAPQVVRRQSIDAAVAQAVLEERYGVAVARGAVEAKVSKASITRALAGIPESKGETRATLSVIAARGGVSVSTHEQFRESRAKGDE